MSAIAEVGLEPAAVTSGSSALTSPCVKIKQA